MEYFRTHKFLTGLVLALILVILIGVAAMGIANWRASRKSANQATNSTVPMQIVKQDIDTKVLPEGLPTDLPIEAGAKVSQNYMVTAPDGRKQSTRVYETSRSLDQAKKAYSDYLNKNGWKITASADLDNLKTFVATKDGSTFQIDISLITSRQVRVVSLSLTEPKK